MSLESICAQLTESVNALTKTLQSFQPNVIQSTPSKSQDEEVQPKQAKVKKAAAVEDESEEDQEEDIKPAKKVKKTKQAETTKDANGKSNVTHEETLKLARLKIHEGHDRNLIKAKIEELGGVGIESLTQEARNELYDWLTELTLSSSDDL